MEHGRSLVWDFLNRGIDRGSVNRSFSCHFLYIGPDKFARLCILGCTLLLFYL